MKPFFVMQLNLDKFIPAFALLSDAQYRAAHNALNTAWRAVDHDWPDGCLPDDDETLQRIAGGKRPRHGVAGIRLIFKPSLTHRNYLECAWLSESLARARANHLSVRTRGQKGGRPKHRQEQKPMQDKHLHERAEEGPPEGHISWHLFKNEAEVQAQLIAQLEAGHVVEGVADGKQESKPTESIHIDLYTRENASPPLAPPRQGAQVEEKGFSRGEEERPATRHVNAEPTILSSVVQDVLNSACSDGVVDEAPRDIRKAPDAPRVPSRQIGESDDWRKRLVAFQTPRQMAESMNLTQPETTQ